MQLDQPRRLRRLRKQVGALAQQHAQAHHHFFAQRVDGRVGHLGKPLLEILEERARQVAQHRGRRVIAHRADRLFAVRDHRAQDDDHLLAGVAKADLALRQRRRRLCVVVTVCRSDAPLPFCSSIPPLPRAASARPACRGDLGDRATTRFSLHPAVIGPARGKLAGDLRIVHDQRRGSCRRRKSGPAPGAPCGSTRASSYATAPASLALIT